MLLYINYVLLQGFELKSLVTELVRSNFISSRLLSIVDTSLMKMYPKFVQSKVITIDDLQEWDFWPKVLMHYGMWAIFKPGVCWPQASAHLVS